jgi:hypothetical protein
MSYETQLTNDSTLKASPMQQLKREPKWKKLYFYFLILVLTIPTGKLYE